MAEESTRRSALEIFQKVEENAHDELRRSSRALAFSGVAGGMGMGLTGLAVASARYVLGNGAWQADSPTQEATRPGAQTRSTPR